VGKKKEKKNTNKKFNPVQSHTHLLLRPGISRRTGDVLRRASDDETTWPGQ
jgi:hypothetical protein